MRALCLLHESLAARRTGFERGLARAGFDPVAALPQPGPGDLLIIWNRYGRYHRLAVQVEKAGGRVLVCENGYLGKRWLGRHWIAMSLGHHAGAGHWHHGGPQRWDALGVEIAPWREGGHEVVILAQRGIGEAGIAAPTGWAQAVRRRIGGRIRHHPGRADPGDLLEDLRDAACVVTWHSGAALKALLAGIPVWYAFDRWIGAPACGRLAAFGPVPVRGDRLEMFRRLAWAQWSFDEIESGEAFLWLA